MLRTKENLASKKGFGIARHGETVQHSTLKVRECGPGTIADRSLTSFSEKWGEVVDLNPTRGHVKRKNTRYASL